MNLLISRLQDLTMQTLKNIECTTYEELDSFIEERGEICAALVHESSLNGALNEEQKAELRTILSQDHVIIERMESLKSDASEWLFRNQQIKSGKQAYNADFEYESMFVDYKK